MSLIPPNVTAQALLVKQGRQSLNRRVGMTDLELRRRRAAYRATHRGNKEMDWLLGRFAQARVAAMSVDELAIFERLLAMNDPELHSWILAPEQVATSELAPLVAELRRFHSLK
jgi:antitoxin CptB